MKKLPDHYLPPASEVFSFKSAACILEDSMASGDYADDIVAPGFDDQDWT